jgi:predicted nucleotidyltransferase
MNHENFTPYPDINKVLDSLTQGIEEILKDNFMGIYLMGSLSYGDFNPDNSDIDLVVIVNDPLSPEQLEDLKRMHFYVEESNKKWAKRIECSYLPMEMLPNILPPKTPRPYFGEGIFYPEAPYGNEWIINQYLLYNHGVALRGPDFKTFVKSIDMEDVRKACIRDLFEEWEPKMNDPEWLNNSHYQSYIILNLCRILYTVTCHSTASKKASAAWVKCEYGPHWDHLIQTAEDWHYGKEMTLQEEILEFIKFVIEKVKEI